MKALVQQLDLYLLSLAEQSKSTLQLFSQLADAGQWQYGITNATVELCSQSPCYCLEELSTGKESYLVWDVPAQWILLLLWPSL